MVVCRRRGDHPTCCPACSQPLPDTFAATAVPSARPRRIGTLHTTLLGYASADCRLTSSIPSRPVTAPHPTVFRFSRRRPPKRTHRVGRGTTSGRVGVFVPMLTVDHSLSSAGRDGRRRHPVGPSTSSADLQVTGLAQAVTIRIDHVRAHVRHSEGSPCAPSAERRALQNRLTSAGAGIHRPRMFAAIDRGWNGGQRRPLLGRCHHAPRLAQDDDL